ncbi:MAG: acyl-CoA thioester hydrolase/BAAT C-terminal domain-containing protein [Litorimonas sp.]
MKNALTNLRYICLLSGLIISTGCQTIPPEPEFKIPEKFSWEQTPNISAVNLEANTTYVLSLERPSKRSAERTLTSTTSYVTNAKGQLSTGSNSSREAYEPFRTLKAIEEKSEVKDGFIKVTLKSTSGEPVLSETVPLGADKSKMIETPLGDNFPGAFILKSKTRKTKQPILVVLGGSEGGDGAARSQAPEFVDQGFIVLGLPYHSPAWYGQTQQFPDLPRAFDNLPIDYLEEAVAQVRLDKDVDPDRVLLMGGSKGAEFVMLAGALIPDDSDGGGFCAIVADVPTDVVWEGWGRQNATEKYSGFSWRGEELPFVPYVDMGRALSARQTGDSYTMTQAHERGRDAFPDRVKAARINVEAIDEPLLLIGGDKDATWASAKMSRTVAQSRKAAGLETEIYVYTDASHAVGGSPLSTVSEADLNARIENYPAMMAFLKRHAKRDDCRE